MYEPTIHVDHSPGKIMCFQIDVSEARCIFNGGTGLSVGETAEL